MKKFAVLLATAILGSAAFAAGTNLLQDEPSLDPGPPVGGSSPGELDLISPPLDGGLVPTEDPDPVQTEKPQPSGLFTPDRQPDESPANDSFRKPRSLQPKPPMPNSRFDDDRVDGGSGASMEAPGRGFDTGSGMSGPGGMSGPHGRYTRIRSVPRTVIEQRMEEVPKEEIAEIKKLENATRLLHTSKDLAERDVATEFIREQLNTQFDRDLKRREKELADIEARVKTLREQVEKRKAARDRIIGLRLDTIVNEAEGLGFPVDTIKTSGFDHLFGPGLEPEPDTFNSSTKFSRDEDIYDNPRKGPNLDAPAQNRPVDTLDPMTFPNANR